MTAVQTYGQQAAYLSFRIFFWDQIFCQALLNAGHKLSDGTNSILVPSLLTVGLGPGKTK